MAVALAAWVALPRSATSSPSLGSLAAVVTPTAEATETPSASPSPTAAPTATPSPSGTATPRPTKKPTPAPTPTPEPSAVLIGAGDICRLSAIDGAQDTADVVEALPGALVFTLGDNSNDSGTADQYATCYSPTWGAFKGRTHPTAGNHDQLTSNGAPYYAYFGSAAGPTGLGYYSYDLPAGWHVLVLNAICAEVGGCGAGSPEETWLRADLAANPGKHILAMWHVPEFSSGWHGGTTAYQPWWQDLYDAHAEIVLNGHDHDYERFARQSPAGAADEEGMRQFVVGTGGAGQRAFGSVQANSEVRNTGTDGVLMLTLRSHSYSWQFIPIAGGSFGDSGQTATHS
jgi:hypothetical protein